MKQFLRFFSAAVLFLFIHFTAISQCDINQINTVMQNAGCIPLNLPQNCQSSCSMYFYNPQSMTGSQAQNYAQQFGANLISVSDANENACITQALSQFGGVIWIGFNDSQTEGTFEWYDQSDVTYTNWNPATPEPNNQTPSCCNIPLFGCGGDPECTEGEDCVQIFPDGLWNDLYCGSSNSSSVIEFNLCPEVTIDASTTNVCQGGSVTLTASTILGSNPYTYDWSDGQTGATITVNPTQTTTYTVTSTDRYGCEGTAQVTITVDPCQPPLSTCDIPLINQTFINAGCIPLNLPQNCQNSCSMYFLNPQSMTGSQAQNFARQYGANLISVADANENACITQALAQYGGIIWIGFNDEQVEGTFEWYDQSPVTYTNWDLSVPEPNNQGNEDCTQIYPNGLWNDLPCGSSNAQSVIEVNLCPQITITASANNVCGGTPVTIDASTILGSDPYTYNWDNGDNGPSITVSPTQTTTYVLTVVDRYSCSAQDSITIDVIPTPEATFSTTSPACESAPVTVEYTGSASSNATYNWDFDGGTVVSGTGQGPYEISWPTSGTYNLSLDVSENGCNSTTETGQVQVNPNPTADVTFTAECEGSATTLTNASTGNGGTIAGYVWVMDGDTLNGMDQSYTFSAPGTYDVQLGVATTDGCVDQTSQQVTVHPNPVADFSADQVCLGEATSFDGQSTISGGTITSYQWDFGDGGTATAADTTYEFSSAASHNVELVVISDQNCPDTIEQTVDVFENPVADFTVQDVCADSTAQFTDASTIGSGNVTNWQWDFGNGSTSNAQNPMTVYATANTYDVQLIAFAGTCSDTTSEQIEIFENPVADFTAPDVCLDDDAVFTDNSSITSGSISSWDWDFGDNNTSTSDSPTHAYASDGTYTVTLTVNSNDNCTNTTQQDIIIFPEPTADFSADAVCLNELTNFNDESTISGSTISTYSWDFGDNAGTSSNASPGYTYQSDGDYTVTLEVTTADGCVDQITQDITVYPLPEADFTVQRDSVCEPFEVQFIDASTITSGNVVQWNWNVSNGFSSISSSPSFLFTQAGTYDVTLEVTSDQGCKDTIVVNGALNVFPKPTAKFSFAPQPASEFDPEIDFTDLSTGADFWFYDFGNGNSSEAQNPTHYYGTHGVFTVTQIVSTEFGCLDTISYDVIIDQEFTFYIPNAFTPNSDGHNDNFFAKGIGVEEYKYYIFNRWGEIIHIGDHTEPEWNGRHMNTQRDVEQGIYVYRYDVIDFRGEIRQFRGDVRLIR